MRSARRNLQWVLALAVVAVIALPAAAPARAKPTCERPGSKTVAENAVARLFTPKQGFGLLGCWKKRGRARSLPGPEPRCWHRPSPELVRLRGGFAAFYSLRFEFGPGAPTGCVAARDPQQFIHVVDLRDWISRRYQVPSRPADGRLLLDARGAVAWPSWLPQNQVELRVIDANGSQNPGAGPFDLFGRVIDTGAIHPESVTLSPQGELYWDNGNAGHLIYLAPFNDFP